MSAGPSAAVNEGRIYGEIHTVDGEVFEGLIRWDRNESDWVDILNATKEIPRKYSREYERSGGRHRESRSRKIELFGLKIYDEGRDWTYSRSAESGIRFGHIRSLEVLGDNEALLTLKSGEEVELISNSTDIGSSIREIVIEDEREGKLGLVWDDIDRIEFRSAPAGERSDFGDRLYGTLTTRRGQTFAGFVCWDVDELFTSDILDGEDRRRDKEIEFGEIASIERYSSSAATVMLRKGDEVVLRGTQDVNDGNRGIIISDPGFGQVRVDWDEFDRLDFAEAPQAVKYDDFDGGRPLHGTVYCEDGEEYTGTIRWDNDEEYTWEILDGSYRGLEYDLEFGLIKEIRKKSHGAVVTVWDGREFRLRDSNDIDDDNKGIYIMSEDGDQIVVDWDDFERIEFSKR
jgi:hypothetical protein